MSDQFLFLHKTHHKTSMDFNYQKRQEEIVANAIYQSLKKDKKAIQNYLRKLDSQKWILDSLSIFLDSYISPLVQKLIDKVKPIIKRGAKDHEHASKIPNFEIDFSIPTKPEAIYIEALKWLHLSQRKWSISLTTSERIQDAVVKWVKNWLSYSEIADTIEELDPFVFSRNRAELIAINQVGKAYQFWEFRASQELVNQWYSVYKKWSTVHDSRVTKTHTQNEEDWWVMLEKKFSWTGDIIPPASDNPRCRCSLLYHVE